MSCSKNFGLYRERVGALHVISETPEAADAVLSQLVRIARTIYSMPPDHGAAIVQEILGDAALRAKWVSEVTAMRTRVTGLREALVGELSARCPQRDFSFIARQRGMFSFLGVNAGAGAAAARAASRLHDGRQPHEHRGTAQGEHRLLRKGRRGRAREELTSRRCPRYAGSGRACVDFTSSITKYVCVCCTPRTVPTLSRKRR